MGAYHRIYSESDNELRLVVQTRSSETPSFFARDDCQSNDHPARKQYETFVSARGKIRL